MERGVAPQVAKGLISEKKYKEKIRQQRKESEANLPFQIRPASESKSNSKVCNLPYLCKCENTLWVNKNTFMVICSKCKEAVKISDLEKQEVQETSTEISVTQYKDVITKPGPFTRDYNIDRSKGKWV